MQQSVMKSHPTWVRGLKPLVLAAGAMVAKVAPYVGAWIETDYLNNKYYVDDVAPYVGAWIET